MICRGLKKGQTFEDGGRVFVVEKVLPDGNYLSRQVNGEELETAAKAEAKTATKAKAEVEKQTAPESDSAK